MADVSVMNIDGIMNSAKYLEILAVASARRFKLVHIQ